MVSSTWVSEDQAARTGTEDWWLAIKMGKDLKLLQHCIVKERGSEQSWHEPGGGFSLGTARAWQWMDGEAEGAGKSREEGKRRVKNVCGIQMNFSDAWDKADAAWELICCARALQSQRSRGWTAASTAPERYGAPSLNAVLILRTVLLCLQIPPCPIKYSSLRASGLESLEGQRVNNIRRLINFPSSQETVPTEDALCIASCTQGFFVCAFLKGLPVCPKRAIPIWRPDVFLY